MELPLNHRLLSHKFGKDWRNDDLILRSENRSLVDIEQLGRRVELCVWKVPNWIAASAPFSERTGCNKLATSRAFVFW